jgi:hypothetical protein
MTRTRIDGAPPTDYPLIEPAEIPAAGNMHHPHGMREFSGTGCRTLPDSCGGLGKLDQR